MPTPTAIPNVSSSQAVQSKPNGIVLVLAVDAAGRCIGGATATVIAGQRSGETLTQVTPCDVWSAEGGFLWRDLDPQASMTIRVSAPFRIDAERTLTPQVGAVMATVIELAQKQ